MNRVGSGNSFGKPGKRRRRRRRGGGGDGIEYTADPDLLVLVRGRLLYGCTTSRSRRAQSGAAFECNGLVT